MLTNYSEIKEELDVALKTAGRRPEDVTLVAVSKTVGITEVEDAANQGACDFGENRPESLVQKASTLPQLRWHFIGNIQSRQLKNIVPFAHLIHSLCDLKHAAKIDSIAGEIGKVQHVLVQINVSGEESKSGIHRGEIEDFLLECNKFKHISVDGLMTMAAKDDSEHADLPSPYHVFDRARSVLLDCQKFMPDNFKELSCGMTDDWREAIKCGSTIVRVGRAIFS